MKRTWLKHAFAVDPPGPCEPTPAQREVVERLCRVIVLRRMATPALLGLELARPLNYMGSQAMHFFHPMISAFIPAQGWKHVAEYLEHRGAAEWIRLRIEEIEAEGAKQA